MTRFSILMHILLSKPQTRWLNITIPICLSLLRRLLGSIVASLPPPPPIPPPVVAPPAVPPIQPPPVQLPPIQPPPFIPPPVPVQQPHLVAAAHAQPANSATPFLCEGPRCVSLTKALRGSVTCRFRHCAKCCAREFKIAHKTDIPWLQCSTHHTVNLNQPGLAKPPAAVPPNPQHGDMGIIPVPVLVKPHAGDMQVHLKLTSVGPLWKKTATEAKNKAEDIQCQHLDKCKLKAAQYHNITLVLWSEADCDPVIYPHVVETFPSFILRTVTRLIQDCDLAIKPNDWLSTWNMQTHEWEFLTLETLRYVTSGQRLLYKVTHNISTQLPNDLCPGLLKELAAQPLLGKHKHGAEDLVRPVRALDGASPSPSKVSHNLSKAPTASSSSQHSHISPKPTISTQMSSRASSIAATNRIFAESREALIKAQELQQRKVAHCHRHAARALEKLKGKGKERLRKKEKKGKDKCEHKDKNAKKNKCTWPTGFYVSEVSTGLEYVAEGQQQSRPQDILYSEFYGSGQKLMRSTFNKYRAWWKKVPEDIKEDFVSYGPTKWGKWRRFSAAVKHGF
ncbi:hypothetical protein K439DRAFT_1618383 [Ramaria rubella]|nr:hypothetical protein K439DRAFT_1618383 [Ramaria rubella]